ncbi:amidohydrolase family protein [Mycolicibacterium pallens]|uniref:Amidohydrolase n=1 Tax=Mycolicibacterium pallens TaxID=370524 RepID=A0ABX8VMI2_9MYCO|nr:amidohydrolase family protein [Mycolicibacterium pallens]QYL16714.1 amidohydrolase [Mycolicibacterium pallens]
MIIDIHGHYTTAPPAHQAFRDQQLAALEDPSAPAPAAPRIGDDELRESVENNQLRVLRERGGDLMLLSPRASGMEHHVADQATATAWARASNDLVHRVAQLYPDAFAPVAQLPQTPSGDLRPVVDELRRCLDELGFVACNVNPDPTAGYWTTPPMTDEYWYPLYEAMIDLEVPAMLHVSTSCNPNFHTLGAHYLNADTSVFMQFVQSDLFQRYPKLTFVIPHGGGAVPYHWGRYRGLAARLGRPDPSELLRNVFFDTCVYHQAGIDLLHRVIGPANLLFASEMLGAVRGADPDTGVAWDDTLVYINKLGLGEEDHHAVVQGNARRVYPRLDRYLASRKPAGNESAAVDVDVRFG